MDEVMVITKITSILPKEYMDFTSSWNSAAQTKNSSFTTNSGRKEIYKTQTRNNYDIQRREYYQRQCMLSM